MTSRSLAMSVTVRVIGPSDPRRDGQPAHTPPRLTRPGVGRMPTMLFHVDGRRIEANPSWPTPMVAKLADTAAPVPPDEPPTVRSGSYGLRVKPNSEPNASPPPISPSVTLAMTIAPAFFSFSVTNASRVGTLSLNTTDPSVVGRPATSI